MSFKYYFVLQIPDFVFLLFMVCVNIGTQDLTNMISFSKSWISFSYYLLCYIMYPNADIITFLSRILQSGKKQAPKVG